MEKISPPLVASLAFPLELESPSPSTHEKQKKEIGAK
jgi:hypothetical protein